MLKLQTASSVQALQSPALAGGPVSVQREKLHTLCPPLILIGYVTKHSGLLAGAWF